MTACPSRLTPDAWRRLRQHTPARIALGRAGASLPTAEVLAFAAAHAAARDAVHAELDRDAIVRALLPLRCPVLSLDTLATDRLTYLQRPDLGRRLDTRSRELLASSNSTGDVAVIIADGLSALAANRHAATLLSLLVPMLVDAGLTLAPIAVVRQGRVAVQDEIGMAFQAQAALILLGERPGLGAADSLGAYIVYAPRIGNTDANRNCVSNIRPTGLPLSVAAAMIRALLVESIRRKISGIALKDSRGMRLLP